MMNVITIAQIAAIPIATVPENSVNDATSIAIIAIAREGMKIFKPNFSAFNVVNVSSNCLSVPILICFVADKTAINTTRIPTIMLGM